MTDYKTLVKMIENLAEESSDLIPLFANASALLFGTMDDVNWAGFYIVRDGVLLLGPFQGKVACVKIAKGRGVCGRAWEENRTMIVPDVHRFPGHIACDAESRSEIVVPVRTGGVVAAVLDIDSPVPGRFTADDAEGLEYLVSAIERIAEKTR
ncbi:MAG: GAF domain-containing protein [Clostridia bacterium]|nr:GAF domain-containing protein [Clostridia bacterium]